MSCEYCMKIGGKHDSRCPNYEPPKTHYYCSICSEGIYDGDEYIENENNEYAHLECVDSGREMAKFLGYDVNYMHEDEYFSF